jgi:hypothetical protein
MLSSPLSRRQDSPRDPKLMATRAVSLRGFD